MITTPPRHFKGFPSDKKAFCLSVLYQFALTMANNGGPGQGTQYLVPVKSAKHLGYFDIKLGASKIYEWSELTLCLLTGRGSLVDASGYSFTDKDTKPGKIKVKKTSKASTKKKADGTAPQTCFYGH